jgi:predicted ATP-grasp superfamily ATP-dependent carboligase
MRANVFITDGHWRKSLAATRALGRQGIHVTVGETTRLATAAFSKYCRRAVIYPSPLLQPQAFVARLDKLLSQHVYEMLIAMEDQTLDLITRNRDQFARLTYLPMGTNTQLRTARRKDKVLKLAASLGIPIPQTWYIHALTQIDTLKATLPYPVVVKPRVGSGAVGIAYPRNAHELAVQYREVHRHSPYPLIQEKIPTEGAGYGASFLMDENSTVKAAFVHKRLREYPVSGGASTLRESVRDDGLRDMGEALLKALGWFGVAMVEFKIDPRDNTPKLMEINPRFWGSLALAIAAGVNFPYLLLRMARGEKFKPVERYTLGTKCRWLLPGDLLHFIRNPERARLQPSFFKFRGPDLAYDILSLRDPLPVLARALTPLTFLYDPDMQTRLQMRKT